MNKDFPEIIVAGENSLIVYFSERPCEKTSSLIAHTASQLQKKLNHNLIDLVPSYHSLLVTYNACLLYTSPSPRDRSLSRMPSSA